MDHSGAQVVVLVQVYHPDDWRRIKGHIRHPPGLATNKPPAPPKPPGFCWLLPEVVPAGPPPVTTWSPTLMPDWTSTERPSLMPNCTRTGVTLPFCITNSTPGLPGCSNCTAPQIGRAH